MMKFILLLMITAISASTQSQTGNAGIGTSTPNARLDVSASTGNTAVGFEAASFSKFGHNNIAIGYQSSRANLSGVNNSAIGTGALINSLDWNNTALGFYSGYSNVSRNDNVLLGFYAGFDELGSNKLYIHNSNARFCMG